ALDADPATGYSVYTDRSALGWIQVAGTSAAAPLWAAYTELANQSRAAIAGQGPVGFPNFALYDIAVDPTFFTDFHDISDSSTNGFYHSGPAGDDTTGLGTLDMWLLMAPLTGEATGYARPLAPTGLAATAGDRTATVTWH